MPPESRKITTGGGDRSGRKITNVVEATCLLAASCGFVFGYNIGISGHVATMEPFLEKFFPSILKNAKESQSKNRIFYCVYDNQVLTAFASSLYIAGLVSSVIASKLPTTFGRNNVLILAGITFVIGSALNAAAENVAMLICGRILLGFGVGFAYQTAPVYLSEIAPPFQWWETVNTSFQNSIFIGVNISNCMKIVTGKKSWGWRLSLGFAAVPGVIITIGAFLISDTPSSLVQRGKIEQAKEALVRIRGTTEIEHELTDLINASEVAKSISQEPFFTIFQRQYRPHLVMAIALPFFHQLTGINIVASYATVLLQSVGFRNDTALQNAIAILVVVSVISIAISPIFMLHNFGRRTMFLEGGLQMFVSQIAVAFVLAGSGNNLLSEGNANSVLALMCLYISGFVLSWGILTCLIPNEMFPLKIRTTGQTIFLAVNFATTFIVSQTFFTMLCHFKYGACLFYAGWVALMTLFVLVFLPETKDIPLHSMHQAWEQHWFWSRFVR